MPFGGKIVEEYNYGISIGIILPDAIVDYLPHRSDQNVACEYQTHAYTVINNRVDLAASKLSSYLNRKGFRSLPIAVAERTNSDDAIPTVSHKMIAHMCRVITPPYKVNSHR